MKMKYVLLSGAMGVLSILMLSMCAKKKSNVGNIDNSIIGAIDSAVTSSSKFGDDLYRELAKIYPENIVFSPISVTIVLSMVYAGARDETRKEIGAVLYDSGKNSKLSESYGSLQLYMNRIGENTDNTLSMANSLWMQRGMGIAKKFVAENEKYYGDFIHSVDFRKKKAAAKKINKWISKKTKKKIVDIMNPENIQADMKMVLCNAVYFNGKWKNKFNKDITADDKFYVSDDKVITVPMMTQTDKFKYKEFDDFKALELPYNGNELSMIVFLPDEYTGLPALEEEMYNEGLEVWIKKLISVGNSEVEVFLPKFKFRTHYILNRPLSGLGMTTAFNKERADFSGITNEEIYIHDILQEVYISVDESGTEAVAVTIGSGMVMSSSPFETRKINIFRADHPFIFLIRENNTGAIIFVGRMINPKEQSHIRQGLSPITE